jgi:hypothetical protein
MHMNPLHWSEVFISIRKRISGNDAAGVSPSIFRFRCSRVVTRVQVGRKDFAGRSGRVQLVRERERERGSLKVN